MSEFSGTLASISLVEGRPKDVLGFLGRVPGSLLELGVFGCDWHLVGVLLGDILAGKVLAV